jgi:hypothetical protein
MHEFATVTIWFSLYIAGMLLTMLMPKLFSEPSRIERNQDDRMRASSCKQLEGQKTLINVMCCSPLGEDIDLQTCCPSEI